MVKNRLEYDDLVCERRINSYEELMEIKDIYFSSRKDKCPIDLRHKCIFRGMGNYKFELIPKSLRKDENNNYVISDYLNSKIFLNKYHSPIFDNKDFDDDELDFEKQFKRELFVLFNFLDWADKSGLKVPFSIDVRKLLHANIDKFPDHWPTSKFFEVISLAQHFKLPTGALDWSYDYKVALYFAVESILQEDTSDCVLWAFNYKPFEKFSSHILSKQLSEDNKPQLRFYRPKYYNNPNIQAQKGLFTIIVNNEKSFNEEPLDQIILNEINTDFEINDNHEITIKIKGIPEHTFKPNEKIFYKFIISGKIKHEILKELYLDGYSEEYLFPGYHGVVRAIENKIKLEKVCKKLNSKRFDILLNVSKREFKDIFENKVKFIFKSVELKKNIGKVFVCCENKVYGHFDGHRIYRDSCKKVLQKFSNRNENDYKQLSNDEEYCIAIEIINFKKFSYPIDIYGLDENKFWYIKDHDNLKFLWNFND